MTNHGSEAFVVGTEQVTIGPGVFIAPDAVVRGRVAIGPQSSVWFTSVVRGDSAPITIGARSNVQDGSVVHVDEGTPVRIGEGVTIGHRCIVHGCTIGDGSLIGMGSIVMNRAVIGEECLVGAGSLVTEGKVFPPRTLILGTPARAVRPLRQGEIDELRRSAAHYVDAAAAYLGAT